MITAKTTQRTVTRHEDLAVARLWRATPLAAMAAALANAIVYAIAEGVGALPNSVLVPTAAGERPLALGEVVFGSVMPIIGAGIVLAILARFTDRPLRAFWKIAAVVLLISLGTPLTLPDAPGDMVVALSVMHVMTAAVGLSVMTRLARSR
jgi:Family of unknown function (DUF6069)